MSLVKHTWIEEEYRAHNDVGTILCCSVCKNYKQSADESDYGCPEILYDRHHLPGSGNGYVSFTEPTKVEVKYTYAPSKFKPSGDKIKDSVFKMVEPRDCLGGTMTCTRDGQVIKIYELPGWKDTSLQGLRMVSIGDMLDYSTMKEGLGKSQTPFIDLIETSKPEIKDWRYRPETVAPSSHTVDTI